MFMLGCEGVVADEFDPLVVHCVFMDWVGVEYLGRFDFGKKVARSEEEVDSRARDSVVYGVLVICVHCFGGV